MKLSIEYSSLQKLINYGEFKQSRIKEYTKFLLNKHKKANINNIFPINKEIIFIKNEEIINVFIKVKKSLNNYLNSDLIKEDHSKKDEDSNINICNINVDCNYKEYSVMKFGVTTELLNNVIKNSDDYFSINNKNTSLLEEEFYIEEIKTNKHVNWINQDDNNNEKGNLNGITKFMFLSYYKTDIMLILIHNILLCLINNDFIFSFYHLNSFLEDLTKKNILTIREKIKIVKYEDKENVMKIEEKVFSLLKILNNRELLTFIGIRETPGSVNYKFPLNENNLNDNFNKLHTTVVNPIILKKNPNAKPSPLTVGGRAFCKHCHRASDGFWPQATGSDSNKNNMALKLYNRFINECVWINIHGLPGELPVIELRVKEGYGIRFLMNGDFRGFVEPPMIDGHEKGWKH